MQLFNILFTSIVIIKYPGTNAEDASSTTTENYEIDEENHERDLLNDHTFVALIDIVFTDGTKKTCTGSIIHDYVVITAAHCFIHQTDSEIMPEITLSFVVIGSKKMFDTGYEQYLPIERIITHPRFSGFSGWTADLSLVHTFASMVSDKPGTTIPLAGEKTSTHVDMNVMLLSWGQMKDKHSVVSTEVDHDSSEGESIEGRARRVTVMRLSRSKQDVTSNKLYKSEVKFRKRNPLLQVHSSEKQKTQKKLSLVEQARSQNTKLISRYLMARKRIVSNQSIFRKDNPKINADVKEHNIKSYFSNWRRSMGSQQNRLEVENFGFVNFQSCKLIVQKSMHSRFDISEANDVVCYANENRFITNSDSGAPAVRRGQLVAVTVGGTQFEGDYVAVGMKMSCYCNWIADNLPDGGRNLQCCKDCCDVQNKQKHNKTQHEVRKKLKHMNKK